MNERRNILLGTINQIPIGQGRCFIVQEHSIAVFRPRGGGLYALDNRCPHQGGPLAEGVIGDCKVICPLHGHKFDLISGRGIEPSETIRTFKVWEDSGNIFIEIGSHAEMKNQTLAAI